MGGELTDPSSSSLPPVRDLPLYAILRTSTGFDHWPGEAHEVWEADYHPALRGWESNVLDAGDVRRDAARRIQRAFFLTAGKNNRLLDKTLGIPSGFPCGRTLSQRVFCLPAARRPGDDQPADQRVAHLRTGRIFSPSPMRSAVWIPTGGSSFSTQDGGTICTGLLRSCARDDGHLRMTMRSRGLMPSPATARSRSVTKILSTAPSR